MKTSFIILAFFLASNLICQKKYIDLTGGASNSSEKDNWVLLREHFTGCTNAELDAQGFMSDYGWGCHLIGEEAVLLAENRVCGNQDGVDIIGKYNPNVDYNCMHNNGTNGNGATSHYSGGILHCNIGSELVRNDENTILYGYVEAKITVPSITGYYAHFWLFGHGDPNDATPNTFHNEIDIMEWGIGDVVVHTSNYKPNQNGANTIFQKWNYTLPGQSFSGTSVTYAVQWEPNKMVWYINNKPVRTTINIGPGGIPNPNKRMGVIAGYMPSKKIGNKASYLPNADSASMNIEYIRLFQREDDSYHHGIIDYLINGKKGLSINAPVTIPNQITNQKIIIDNNKSFLPNHFLYVYVEMLIDSSWYYFGKTWIKPGDTSNMAETLCNRQIPTTFDYRMYNFNLNDFIDLQGGDDNVIYKLTLGSYDPETNDFCGPDIFETQYLKITPCEPKIEFKLNGISNCNDNSNGFMCTNPIEISDNHGKSRIILDGSLSVTCSSDYFVSIAEADSVGNINQASEVYRWLTQDEVDNIEFFDLDNFASTMGLPFEGGKYYRVKLATGHDSSWYSNVKLIYIETCVIDSKFTLNNVTSSPTQGMGTINTLQYNLGSNLNIDASASRFCSKNFTIKIEELGAHGYSDFLSRTFPSVYAYLDSLVSNDTQYKYFQSELDVIQELILDYTTNMTGKKFKCDSTYRISLIICNPSNNCVSESVIMHVNACNPNSDFMLHQQYCSTFSDTGIFNMYVSLGDLVMWAPNYISCNDTTILKIAAIPPTLGSTTQRIILGSSPPQGQRNLINSGDLNVSRILVDRFGANALDTGRRYSICLLAKNSCSNDSVETCKEVFFHSSDHCGAPFNNINTRNLKKDIGFDNIIIYPNPSTLLFNFESIGNINSISIYNLDGKLINYFSVNKNHFEINMENKPKGIYIAKIVLAGEIIYKKLYLD
ncbi:MAG: family 16 glycosylhydrolase [Saprospiraceae bacterium]|nr:family 16 glycosylhydrolase [Candidatus Defluviibacterium haderslevense]